MDDLIEAALAFVDRSNEIDKPTELIEEFSVVVRQLGFKHFIMTGLPAYGEDVEQLIVANGWPPGWLERYREGRFFFDDPVSKAAFVSAGPYTWRAARERNETTSRTMQIEGEAREFGMVDGIAIPLFDPENWQAIVSLAAEVPIDVPRRVIVLLQGVAPLVHGQLSNLLTGEAPKVPRLTQREAEILTWAAHGKSAWDTGQILSISENTVRFHLKQIRHKLNSSSLTHSVAIAVHSRQIRL